MPIRSWPISRRNSTVLGWTVRGPSGDRWWNHGANWEAAYPTVPMTACLHVPCKRLPTEDGRDFWWDGTEVYRVRPINERGRPMKVNGVWHWHYPTEETD